MPRSCLQAVKSAQPWELADLVMSPPQQAAPKEPACQGQLLLSILTAPGCHISPNIRTDTLSPVRSSSQHHTFSLFNPVPDPENTAMNKMNPRTEPSSPLSPPLPPSPFLGFSCGYSPSESGDRVLLGGPGMESSDSRD